MSNKQSSIEHYEEEINKLINQFFKKSINKTDFIIQNHNLFYKIKEMHKEEMFEYIKQKYCIGQMSLEFHTLEFEQYYNEHYGK